jgi:hypothetical protein
MRGIRGAAVWPKAEVIEKTAAKAATVIVDWEDLGQSRIGKSANQHITMTEESRR